MERLLLIAAGGALGALLRYGVSGMRFSYLDGIYPWGTMSANMIGAFAIGIVWGMFENVHLSPEIRSFVFIGVIASFTTFSTYGLETMNLFRDGETKLAFLNIIATNVVGLLLVFVGFMLARVMTAMLGQGVLIR